MPLFRDYPEAGSLETTDAFVIDREGVGTMFIEGQFIGQPVAVEDEGEPLTPDVSLLNFVGEGVTATANGTEVTVTIPGAGGGGGGAFRASLAVDQTVPINNGFDGNGGFNPTLDTIVIDVADGLNLSYDYGALPDVVESVAFYAPSTAYIIPEGMAGIWSFNWQAFMYSPDNVDEVDIYNVGITHLRADGSFVDTDDPSGSSLEAAYNANLAPGGAGLNTGLAFNFGPAYYNCLEGDLIIPYWQRAHTSHTLAFAGFSTFFQGQKVG